MKEDNNFELRKENFMLKQKNQQLEERIEKLQEQIEKMKYCRNYPQGNADNKIVCERETGKFFGTVS